MSLNKYVFNIHLHFIWVEQGKRQDEEKERDWGGERSHLMSMELNLGLQCDMQGSTHKATSAVSQGGQ